VARSCELDDDASDSDSTELVNTTRRNLCFHSLPFACVKFVGQDDKDFHHHSALYC
jgi:hypothetical protein